MQHTVSYRGQIKGFSEFAENSFTWKYLEIPFFDKYLTPYITPTSTVLEAGCGMGRILNYITHQRIQPQKIVAIESDGEMLKIAKSRFPAVHFIHNSLESAEVQDRSVDVITCMAVLPDNSIEQTNRIIQNFYTWLKLNGVVVTIVPHPVRVVRDQIPTYFNRTKRKVSTPWGTTMYHYHRTVSDYINAFLENNLSVIRVEEPELSPELRSVDVKEYDNYASSPARLAIVAQKIF